MMMMIVVSLQEFLQWSWKHPTINIFLFHKAEWWEWFEEKWDKDNERKEHSNSEWIPKWINVYFAPSWLISWAVDVCCAKFFNTLMRTLISAKQVISPWPLIFGRSKVKVPSESPHHQNLAISSLDDDQYFLKASLQSGHNFWNYFAKRQTNAGGHIISSLGGVNYVNFLWPLFNLVLSTSLWRTVTHSQNKCNKRVHNNLQYSRSTEASHDSCLYWSVL